ncbi:hypothetical protein M407DRAFT_103852 [Tulasnella calospora MUT 4182]|uniref:Uncharacterized protein n=1 Tax=Tulasnella calospora MUT 4182 TaxID=1051891 RepID=A0A0C3LRS9_9AGAM|nr:hypothetical protein M407DRAFT_103852 [Tulasnella calospora MUT 4182]
MIMPPPSPHWDPPANGSSLLATFTSEILYISQPYYCYSTIGMDSAGVLASLRTMKSSCSAGTRDVCYSLETCSRSAMSDFIFYSNARRSKSLYACSLRYPAPLDCLSSSTVLSPYLNGGI